MDILTAVLSCVLHNDPALVRGIINVTSEGRQFWVGDFVTMQGNGAARSAAEGERLVLDVRKKGHTVAVGLMGVPPEWASLYGRSAGQLWGACANVEVGSARLSDFDYACRGRKAKGRRGPIASSRNRACILGKYAAALALPRAFVGDVLKDVYTQRKPTLREEGGGDDDDSLTSADLDEPDVGGRSATPAADGNASPEF